MNVFFPASRDMDMNDTDQFNAYIAALPARAFIVVVLAQLGR
jgi:hypothetical protein